MEDRARSCPFLPQIIFLPTSPGLVERTFLVVCDNCQVKDLVISGGLMRMVWGGPCRVSRLQAQLQGRQWLSSSPSGPEAVLRACSTVY